MQASECEKSIEESAREVKEERDRRVRDATVGTLSGLAVTQFLEMLEQEQVRALIKVCASRLRCIVEFWHMLLPILVCVSVRMCVCVCVLDWEGGEGGGLSAKHVSIVSNDDSVDIQRYDMI